ncbi:PiT family inorganic phosphate transporter [Pedobacter psychrotolerans]|uniref:Phosphate transporter n=1 Tax=Pedobacter psychrotolerans TaxID=1843235 RepID=A0A4R2HM27_9SPHI|nr:inorganic phosphate transporter [Pedobacter psychrotolerans]TCO31158.1 PiT family inorganic phosphate transporter [Pedobacter psychrotolerans]GGE41831.1 phosphate transporter [Pedobacter psychrotolerans]
MSSLSVILPFVGDTHLSTPLLLIFLLCLLAVVAFEFVNGFHDTANAVATVIYTKALKPVIAIPWSGFWNFMGVFTGGIAVAMGILKLVPLDALMNLPIGVGACMVLAVLLASIAWNLGTWYLGIPCSSSHTMIGAMIGAGLAFTWYYGGAGVNWGKAEEIGLSLILSPIIGFGLAILLMYFLKHVIKYHALFHIPQGENDRPPMLIRGLLIMTCTLVSFFHGSNDGQKGVGLLMLILIAFLPAKFAVNHHIAKEKVLTELNSSEVLLKKIAVLNHNEGINMAEFIKRTNQTKIHLAKKNETDKENTYQFRKQIEGVIEMMGKVEANQHIKMNVSDKKQLSEIKGELSKLVDFAPLWVILTISISLGLGTMIGWKRIVVTIGEKIGNEHLNYAQGATSEIVAASTIGLSTAFGLPVSTTHVLSSGIAGAMVASGGRNNLNNNTLKSIGLAWVLTLPVSIVLAILLFMLFHLFI